MAKNVIQRLLADEGDGSSADDLVDGTPELEAAEAGVREQLAKRAAGQPIEEEEEEEEEGDKPDALPKADEPEAPKTASAPVVSPRFLKQVDETILQCDKLAAEYDAAVKTASAGDQASYQAQGLVFRKVAHFMREQKKLNEGYSKYASVVLEQAAEDRLMHETLKVASELFDDGTMVMSEDKPLVDVIRDLSKKDLSAVKVAHELFAGERMQELGTAVERTKRASDEMPRADGSLGAWLAHHPSLSEG